MATVEDYPRAGDEVRCSYHPSVMTRLRCSRCGKPICPQCGVRTPVGLRCPDCAGVRGLPTYRTDSTTLAKAAGLGLAVAVAVGVFWGYFPSWNFYMALLLGFGVAEVMAWASAAKRGRDLQAVAIGAVLVGLVVSRAVIAQRLDISWELINALTPGVEQALYLDLIPDGIYAAIAAAIAWYRFR